jgi:hypothetical protein
MKTKFKIFFLIFLSIGQLFATEMDSFEYTLSKSKKIGVVDAPWPELIIKTKVKASAKEAMAVFSALTYQHKYVPDMLVSRIEKMHSKLVIDTYYEMHVPFPFKNAKYTHRSFLKKENQKYILDWKMIKSNSTKDAEGSAIFIDLKDGECEFTYTTYVYPDSGFAGLVSGLFEKNSINAVRAIVTHVEYLKKNDQKLLEEKVSELNKSFE